MNKPLVVEVYMSDLDDVVNVLEHALVGCVSGCILRLAEETVQTLLEVMWSTKVDEHLLDGGMIETVKAKCSQPCEALELARAVGPVHDSLVLRPINLAKLARLLDASKGIH